MSAEDSQVSTPLVAIVMGSQSDWATMRRAGECLDALGVEYDARIVSAHRTPERLYAFAKGAADEGFKVIVAGAGGAAHLPGMIAALTHLPVLGVPVQSKALSGQDSLLSIVQMPAGVPVGTMAIGEAGASNAGLLAAGILALGDDELAERLREWRARQTESVAERPAADPEPAPPPPTPPPPEAVQPPADPVLPTIEEAPASYVPGWDARAIREIAIERYGGYEPMFEAHGWTERGSEMMRKVQSRVKDHYGSVSTFVEHHRLHRGPLLNSPLRPGGGLDPITT